MGETAKILIVDDDENIRKVLTTILEEEGFIVDSADTVNEAITKTSKEYYNVALIDIRLPDREGIELLSRIRETTPRMRKIIVTGYPTLQNAIDAVNKGADAYIVKPFDVAKTLKTIREELEKQKEDERFSQDKVAAFIETRVRELETTEQLAHRKKP